MTRLPSSKKVVEILIKNVIVPSPRKEIPIGTLKSISRQSGIHLKEFLDQ